MEMSRNGEQWACSGMFLDERSEPSLSVDWGHLSSTSSVPGMTQGKHYLTYVTFLFVSSNVSLMETMLGVFHGFHGFLQKMAQSFPPELAPVGGACSVSVFWWRAETGRW